MAMTEKVVEMARKKAVSVEGELGRLKGIEDNISVAEREAFLTDPEAEEFDPRKILGPGREAIKQTVQSKMRLFGSSARAV